MNERNCSLLTLFLSGGYQIDTCLQFSLYLQHGFCSESEQPDQNRVKSNTINLFIVSPIFESLPMWYERSRLWFESRWPLWAKEDFWLIAIGSGRSSSSTKLTVFWFSFDTFETLAGSGKVGATKGWPCNKSATFLS